MQAAHQDPFHLQALQIFDGLRRWRVAVLDVDSVDLDQAVVIRCRVPAELFLEGGFGFVVAFDGGGAGEGANQCVDAVDEPLG